MSVVSSRLVSVVVKTNSALDFINNNTPEAVVVYAPGGGVCSGGVSAPGGVSALGVYAPGRCLLLGGWVSASGGDVCCGGVWYPSMH